MNNRSCNNTNSIQLINDKEENKQGAQPQTLLKHHRMGNRVRVGSVTLPGGEGGVEIVYSILQYLDAKSLVSFQNASFVKQLGVTFGTNNLLNKFKEILESYKTPFQHAEEKKLNAKYSKHGRNTTYTPFIEACAQGHLENVKRYIEVCGVPANLIGNDKEPIFFGPRYDIIFHEKTTGLIQATRKGKLSVVEYLIKCHSDVIDVNQANP